MRLCRTFFIACALCLAVDLTCVARLDPNVDPIDLEALKAASLVPFCEFMERQHPQIRDWKKGEIPTEKELQVLIRRRPDLAEDLERVRSDFYREIELDKKKAAAFRRKRKIIKRPSLGSKR